MVLLILIVCLCTIGGSTVGAQKAQGDIRVLYSELVGDYEYYVNDRYNRLTVYREDGILKVDERGYPHLVMEPVDLEKLEFKARDARRSYTFQFRKKGGKISNCVWNRGDTSLVSIRYESVYIPKQFTKDELQADFRQMRRLVEETHPIMYEFTPEETFERIYHRQYGLISDAKSLESFFRIAVPFIERIGCGHTNLWMPEGWLSQPSNAYFPVKLCMVDKGAYVIGSAPPIPLGSRVLSINGVEMSKIMDRIESAISGDGFNPYGKLRGMEAMFSFQYAKHFGNYRTSVIRYMPFESRLIKETVVQHVDLKTAQQTYFDKSRLDLDIIEDNNTAVLTINNFYYYRNLETFTSYIDSAFKIIVELNIGHLILDLRGNDGGDPFSAAHLFSYLVDKSVPYFSKPYGKYSRLAEPIPPAENRFSGYLYILINGKCFSTTGHLCSLLSYHKIGTFIGEETGGTYTCNDAKRFYHLKNTRIQLWVASGSFATAVKNMPKDRGIIPDYPVPSRIEDIVKGRDTVMEFALNLINEGKRK